MTDTAVARPVEDSRRGGLRTTLRHRRFCRLLAALTISQAGDWLYNLALLAFVLDRTHSSAFVGLTTAARVLPMVVIGPLGGVLADRVDRRRLMIVCALLQLACMGGLAVVAAFGLPILLAPALAAASTTAGCAVPPCVAAVTPRLVPAADLPAANAVRTAVTYLCVVVGPSIGALLLLLGSPAVAFALNGATFAVSAALVMSLRGGADFQPARSDANSHGVLAELMAGAAALRALPATVSLVGADVMGSVVYGAETVLLLLLAERLGFGAHGYGYLLAANGAGGVLGTAIAGRLASARPRTAVAGALVAISAAVVGMAMTGSSVVALGCAAVVGIGAIVVETVVETELQRTLPPAVFGRAYALALPASLGGIVVGSLVAGPLAAVLGLTGALLAVAVLVTLYAAVCVAPTVRRPRREGVALAIS